MSWGESLQGQTDEVNSFVDRNNNLLQDIREFLKERSRIEKTYATELSRLCKKYSTQRDAVGATAGCVSPDKGLDGLPSPEGSTCFRAWGQLISTVEGCAAMHLQLSEALSSNEIADRIKVLQHKKDEARRKIMQFANKLSDDKDALATEMIKNKDKYDDLCRRVDETRMRIEKENDEKSRDKLNRTLDQLQVDRKNQANEYYLSVEVLNAANRKFFIEDMPGLLNNLQYLSEHRTQRLRGIFEDLIEEEREVLVNSAAEIDKFANSVQSVDERRDSALYVAVSKRYAGQIEPPTLRFDPYPGTSDAPLLKDDSAIVFLGNKLTKLRTRVDQIAKETGPFIKEIEGLRNLRDAYLKTPELGDEDEVHEQILEANRNVTSLLSQKLSTETQIMTITPVLSDSAPSIPHSFKTSSFPIPTQCDLCQSVLFGFSKGLSCTECGFNVHSRCEMKVPARCSRTKGGSKNNRASSYSSIRSSVDSTASTSSADLPPIPIPSSPTIVTPSISSPTTASPGPNQILTSGQKSSNLSSTPQQASSLQPSSANAATILATANIVTVLYDYEPTDPEEVGAKAGEALKILEEENENGWIKVETPSGKVGIFPASYAAAKDFKSGATPTSVGLLATADSAPQVRALYDYEAQSEIELTIHAGDVIHLITKDCPEGWWEGEYQGKRGQFPSAYVEEL